MNTGAEAVETAIKTVRRWAYDVKKVEANRAEIIVCEDNFHWTYNGFCFYVFKRNTSVDSVQCFLASL